MLPPLREASFRGVPFSVLGDGRDSGRRIVTHEYPFQDRPTTRDLGRKAESFSVEAFVVGDDYADRRDALFDALVNEKGPGELIHPRYGRLLVQVGSVSVSHAPNDGGLSKFRITFHETSNDAGGTAIVENLRQKLAEAVDRIDGLSAAVFGDTFDVAGGVTEFATTLVEGTVDIVDAVLSPAVTGEGIGAGFGQNLTDLKSKAGGLVSRPGDLAARIQNLFRQVRGGGVFELLRSVQKAGRLLAALLQPAPDSSVSFRATQEAQAAAGLQALVLGAVTTTAADVAGRLRFQSIEDAYTVRDSVATQIRELESLAQVFDGELSREYRELRIQLARAIPPRDANLARIESYTVAADLPALVLTYQLYGSLEREGDLIERNNLRRPGLIETGRRLLVLR